MHQSNAKLTQSKRFTVEHSDKDLLIVSIKHKISALNVSVDCLKIRQNLYLQLFQQSQCAFEIISFAILIKNSNQIRIHALLHHFSHVICIPFL